MKVSRRKMLGMGATAVTGMISPTMGLAAETPAPPPVIPWPQRRKEIERKWLDLLGDFPTDIPPLKPEMKQVEVKDGITRYHVSFQSEPDDRVTAWLLVPEGARKQPAPAIICIHGTTYGTGKDWTIGLAGLAPGDPPDGPPPKAGGYGRELARWGYVTLSIDLALVNERTPESRLIYDSSAFYRKHPDWSIVGKNNWDAQRSVDFLQTLDFVDPKRIGCVGHSVGGHYTLFAAAFEPRLTASVSNGGVLDWVRNSPHWARPENYDFKAEGGKPPGNFGVYTYIKKFRPYVEDKNKPVPVDFDSLMMLVAPRPLLVMNSEYEFVSHHTMEKLLRALEVYANWQDADGLPSVVASREANPGHAKTLDGYKAYTPEKMRDVYARLGAGDRLAWFSYPGPHAYPPAAKRFSFAWFDRWFGHTPAVPSIWPGVNA
ncbi:MAG: acetylxylan esterase [Verrucomicrobiae bacterium]|nr:acetylxylan esterase [Verrucomicrobiae bacterium]